MFIDAKREFGANRNPTEGRPPARKWFNLPKLTPTETSQAVEHLARLLEIPQDIFSGPLAKGSLNLDSVHLYRWERLQRDFLSKYPGFTWGNPREAAVKSFFRSEEECRATNESLRRVAAAEPGYLLSPGPLDADPVLKRARLFISDVLGRFDWRPVLEKGGFGPGVTSSCKGTRLHDSNKYSSKLEVTPSFAKMGMKLVSSLPSWACLQADIDYPAWVTPLPVIVPGNRVTFVPKNAKTDRAIAVEPTVNIWFQLGIGRVIREKMRRYGWDLIVGQEVNQSLARLGSYDDSLSTIDLERASDTISARLVEYLLPADWFAALNSVRSQFGELPGQGFAPYQKFSSMGNGFTFELESLIFWALSSSVARHNGYNPFWCTSYGDDIVCPSGVYEDVARYLALCGFTVNLEKSYARGPFRESCGKDYLRGRLVRPAYLKEIPDNPLSWIKIANGLKRLAHTWAEFDGLDRRLKKPYDFAVSMIPREIRRLSVSDGYGDVALIRDIDQAHPTRAGGGWEGWITKVLLSRPLEYKTSGRSLITASLGKLGRTGNDLPVRGEVEHTIGPLYIAVWRNMGPWSEG